METWGMGPFENEAALYLVDDLAGRDPGAIVDGLLAAMREVTDANGFLVTEEAEAAVAAAVLVAAHIDREVPASESIEDLVATVAFTVSGELRLEALRVFDRVTDPKENEWHGVLSDLKEIDDVLELLRPYRERLATSGSG